MASRCDFYVAAVGGDRGNYDLPDNPKRYFVLGDFDIVLTYSVNPYSDSDVAVLVCQNTKIVDPH